MSNLPLAITLTLVGSVLNTFSFIFQKKGQLAIGGEYQGIKRVFKSITTPLWLLGFIMNVSTFPLTILAISMGFLSIIMPLNNFGLLILVIFGRAYLKERISKIELAGISILALGCIILGMFYPTENTTPVIEPVAIVIFVILISIIPVIVFAITRIKALGLGLVAGVIMSIVVIIAKLLTLELVHTPFGGFDLFNLEFIMALFFGIFTQHVIISTFFYAIILIILVNQVALIFALSKGKAIFVVPIEKM
nr:hypothetical protein [Candidatus Sigynarchaeota archaeon]